MLTWVKVILYALQETARYSQREFSAIEVAEKMQGEDAPLAART